MGAASVSLYSQQAVKKLALRTPTWNSSRVIVKESIQQKNKTVANTVRVLWRVQNCKTIHQKSRLGRSAAWYLRAWRYTAKVPSDWRELFWIAFSWSDKLAVKRKRWRHESQIRVDTLAYLEDEERFHKKLSSIPPKGHFLPCRPKGFLYISFQKLIFGYKNCNTKRHTKYIDNRKQLTA